MLLSAMRFLDLICYAGFVIGHIANLSFSLNWWFGQRLPHRFLSRMRHLHGLLVVTGLAGVGILMLTGDSIWQRNTRTALQNDPSWAMRIAYGYVLWCIFLGLVGVPALSLYKIFRPRPEPFTRFTSQVLDIAAQLDFKPIGKGHYRWMAYLPGNQIYQVELSEKTFAFPRLPAAWDGLTILHLTDLHFHGTPDRIFHEKVMDACMARTPDIVALTGDIVDSPWHHHWIQTILGRLRWNVAGIAIMGNHDRFYKRPGDARRRLLRLGMQVLQNRWIEMRVRGEPLIVIGHQGPWFRPTPNLGACPQGAFRLCLSHTPDNIRWAKANQIDLMLSGHNHGGQIRFPFFGSVLVPSVYSRRYDCGVFWEKPTLLHVSRGLSGQHPLRYNCRPEVTWITLEKGGES
jgi:uncharacterized protein